MCLTQTALVLEVRPDAVVVLTGSKTRLLPNLLVPDVRAGERVVIGLGTVLARDVSDESSTAEPARAPGGGPVSTTHGGT